MTTRLIVVLVVAAVVVGAVLVLRRRPLVSARPIDASGLTSGVYLLTSDECDTCIRARDELVRRGVTRTVWSWHENLDVFERLLIDAVPSGCVVSDYACAYMLRGALYR